ncbi:hypothetical protein Vi05172_g4873 [Venturia inaequalis]|nr:hypothetical protein Vi05172_g4873 [Venturia inaequalis]
MILDEQWTLHKDIERLPVEQVIAARAKGIYHQFKEPST